MSTPAFLRFRDLKERRIVPNRTTLQRWQEKHGFPKPVRIAPNTAVFREEEVLAWLQARGAANPDQAA